MFASVRSGQTISGITVPRRRFTRWAAIYFAAYFVIPLLSVCFLIDLALYFVATDILGSCYAVLCLFE